MLPLVQPARTGKEAHAEQAPCRDAASIRYQQAFEALRRNNFESALQRLQNFPPSSCDPSLEAKASALRALARAKHADQFRSDSAASLEPPPHPRSSYAKWAFVTGATVGGLGVGTMTIFALGARDPRLVASAMVVGSLGAFAGSYLLAPRLALSLPQSSLFDWGLITGAYQGLLLGLSLDSPRETVAGMSLLGTLLGAGLGLYTATSRDISAGASSLLATGIVWGALSGAMLILLLQPTSDQGMATTLLVGSGTGLLLGLTGAVLTNPSQARVLTLNLGIFLGGLVFGGLAVAVSYSLNLPSMPAIVAGAGLGGMVAGGLGALWWSSRSDPEIKALAELGGMQIRLGPPLLLPQISRSRGRGSPILMLPSLRGRF